MFPNVVNSDQAPGVEGDFASTNPFSSILSQGAGQLVAPAGGVAVGRFAFVDPATGNVHQNFTSGYQIGFLGRNQQALITAFLGEETLVVPSGFMITLFNGGDFWARFPNGATSGQTVFADETTGLPVSGSATDTATASAGFTGTATVVAISPVLTIVAATDGILSVGDTISLTGVPAGTTILNQLSGTAGGIGTYTMSVNATTTEASAEAITSTSVVLNVTAILTGGLTVGDVLTGSGVTAGTTITSLPAAGGGVGQYGISVAQTFNPTTVTVTNGNVSTQFTVRSNCGPGQIAKISAAAT